MAHLCVQLFGSFLVQHDDGTPHNIHPYKAQELFSYLLLRRDRVHSREFLAELLWHDYPASHTRKYLRQSVWQLRVSLGLQQHVDGPRLLDVGSDWLRLNSDASIWLDVADFEAAYACLQSIPGSDLEPRDAVRLEQAVVLYGSGLLDGWYQDWCLRERSRLHAICLVILEALMDYSEARRQPGGAIKYGERLLQHDGAHEPTHRRLIRLYDQVGNRPAALRQYDLCFQALREELDVIPSLPTRKLYEQVRDDQPHRDPLPDIVTTVRLPLPDVLNHLRKIDSMLASVREQLHQDIVAVEHALEGDLLP